MVSPNDKIKELLLAHTPLVGKLNPTRSRSQQRTAPRYLRYCACSLFALIALTIFLTTFQPASAQDVNCEGASMAIQGGEPSPFIIPRDQGQTLTVEPDSILLINLGISPTTTIQAPEIAVRVLASGIEVYNITQALGTGRDLEPITLNLKDQLPAGMKGLYEVEGAFRDNGVDVCAVDFLLQVGEFCVASAAGAAVATATSLGALASSVPAMRMMILPTIQRRQSRGWRRYVPVPDVKWTIINTLLGAIAGLVSTTLLFQQTGVTPLSIVNGLWGMLAGGGLTFGVAYMGAIATYVMSPAASPPMIIEDTTAELVESVEDTAGVAESEPDEIIEQAEETEEHQQEPSPDAGH